MRRWATQGFDFLQAIEPVFISALPEDDFLVWIFLKFFFIKKISRSLHLPDRAPFKCSIVVLKDFVA